MSESKKSVTESKMSVTESKKSVTESKKSVPERKNAMGRKHVERDGRRFLSAFLEFGHLN